MDRGKGGGRRCSLRADVTCEILIEVLRMVSSGTIPDPCSPRICKRRVTDVTRLSGSRDSQVGGEAGERKLYDSTIDLSVHMDPMVNVPFPRIEKYYRIGKYTAGKYMSVVSKSRTSLYRWI